MSTKNSNDTSWDRTSDLPICSTTPEPPRSPIYLFIYLYLVWCKAAGHKFSKNLGTSLEIWVTRNKIFTENPQMLGTTVCNLYGQVTCHTVFVPFWYQKYSQRIEPTYIRTNQIEINNIGVLLTVSQKC